MPNTSQLEDRTLVVAAVESAYGDDAITGSLAAKLLTNSLLVSNCDVKTNAGTLERTNYSASLSKDVTGIDRLLYQVTFTTELRASGVFGTAARIGALLKACGFAQTSIADNTNSIIGTTVAGAANTSAASAAIAAGVGKVSKPTKSFDTYRITAVIAGAKGTAAFLVTSAGFPDGDATILPAPVTTVYTNSVLGTVTVGGSIISPTVTFAGTFVADDIIEVYAFGVKFYHQVVSGSTSGTNIADAFEALLQADTRLADSANVGAVLTCTPSGTAVAVVSQAAAVTPLTLGASGGAITMLEFTGSLVVGDYWDVPTRRPGIRYDPVSDAFASLTLYVYFDGQLIKCTGSRGQVQWTGEAGKYPTMEWTFQGIYHDPIDKPVPTSGVSFETSKPWKVELANLAVYGMDNACAQSFSGQIQNNIVAKDCINADEAYDEIRITERTVTLACNPESAKPSVYNPWIKIRQQQYTRYHVMVGKRGGPGNEVHFQADRLGWASPADFANRNKIRAYNFQFRAGFVNGGDDEISITFA